MVDFLTGATAAEAAAASTGGKFHRLDYLRLGEGESATIRLITDHTDLITVVQHFSPTRPAPDGHEGKWPQAMPAVCRNTPAFQQAGTYEDCILDIKWEETKDDRAYKPNIRSWALGVVRIPLMQDGRQIGLQDSMVELEVDGTKAMIPEVVILNFAWNNFWANLNGFVVDHGTWCDRDYRINRTGKGKDTEYRAVPYNPCTTNGFDHTAMLLQRLELLEKGTSVDQLPPEPGEVLDTRNPAHFLRYLPSFQVPESDLSEKHGNSPQALALDQIKTIIMERSSDEYYARFFDERMEQPKTKKKGEKDGQASSETPPPVVSAPSADASQLDALAQRVQGYGQVPEMAQPQG